MGFRFCRDFFPLATRAPLTDVIGGRKTNFSFGILLVALPRRALEPAFAFSKCAEIRPVPKQYLQFSLLPSHAQSRNEPYRGDIDETWLDVKRVREPFAMAVILY